MVVMMTNLGHLMKPCDSQSITEQPYLTETDFFPVFKFMTGLIY